MEPMILMLLVILVAVLFIVFIVLFLLWTLRDLKRIRDHRHRDVGNTGIRRSTKPSSYRLLPDGNNNHDHPHWAKTMSRQHQKTWPSTSASTFYLEMPDADHGDNAGDDNSGSSRRRRPNHSENRPNSSCQMVSKFSPFRFLRRRSLSSSPPPASTNTDHGRKLKTFLQMVSGRRRQPPRQPPEAITKTTMETAEATPVSRPIPIEEFFAVYREKSKDSNFGFEQEFLELERATANHNRLEVVQEHPEKNRFMNVLPYKHSIVPLEQQSSKDSADASAGYINANFIPDWRPDCRPRQYIATLAPWDSNIVRDFLRMVLQYRVPIIVNLMEFENNLYFPRFADEPCQLETADGHRYRVQLEKTLQSPDKTFWIRTVRFITEPSTTETKDQHQVYQFHYTAWKDFSCPDSEQSLLSFIETVWHYYGKATADKMTVAAHPPIVVHCRAGIGRTGTYIAIDRLWRQLTEEFLQPETAKKDNWHRLFIENEKEETIGPSSKQHHSSIDVYGQVYQLRQFRMGMVQTESQYAFIHQCLRHILDRWRCFRSRDFVSSQPDEPSPAEKKPEPDYVALH